MKIVTVDLPASSNDFAGRKYRRENQGVDNRLRYRQCKNDK